MMRHFTKTLNRSVALVLSLALLTPLLFGLLTMAGVGTPTASAAISDSAVTRACKAYLAKLNNVSANDIPNDFRDLEPCKTGYKAGYDNMNQNDTSRTCTTTSKNIGMCINAYKLGQTDAKKAAGTKQPSAAQIKTAAQKACKPWNDQEDVSKNDRTKNYNACIAGYTGQKNGKSTTDACRSYSGVSNKACLQGHDNAVNGKKVVPSTGGAGTATPAPTNPADTAADGEGEDDSKLDCDLGVESTFGESSSSVSNTASNAAYMFNPFNWVFCGVTKALVGMVDWLDSSINSMLSVGSPGNSSEPSQIFATSSGRCADGGACEGYYRAWESFRNIALGLMVIAGLLVLIAQALGMEILDAYTIRKVLPRLLIAAIGITLSWQFMHFAVELTNDLGYGIRRLIYAPFSELNGQIGINLGDSLALTILGGIGWFVTGAAYMMLLVGTALLSLFIAFLILVLREIVILTLIIFAPIAIVAYILPNTQKVWKLWQNSFLGALLMFPLIAAFIALGRVFSTVALTGDNNLLQSSVGFMAYFMPYFMIAKTPQFAGSAVGQIGGFVNGAAQGGFAGLRKKRGAVSADRVKRARSGGIYRKDFGEFTIPFANNKRFGNQIQKRFGDGSNKGSVGRMLNKFGDATLDADEYGVMKFGETRVGKPLAGRRSDILKGQIAEARMDHNKKATQRLGLDYRTGYALAGLHDRFLKSDEWDEEHQDGAAKLQQALIDNDFAVMGADGKATGFKGVSTKEDAERMGQILTTHGVGNKDAMIAGQELLARASRFGDLRGDETRRADLQTVGLMTAAQAGRLENHEISESRNTGVRNDVNGVDAGFATERMTFLQDLAAPKRVEQARGHSISFDAEGEAYSVYDNPASKEALSSLERISAAELGGGKSEAIDSLRDTLLFHGSEYKMKIENGKVIQDLKDGKPQLKDPAERATAKAVQDRIRYIAGYAVGDSGVGKKTQDIATRLGMGDLSFGANRLPTDQQGVPPVTKGDPLANKPPDPGPLGG